jgi:polyisoprenoid-binding protein YceI
MAKRWSFENNDFFDADNHPQIHFESEKLEKINDEQYKFTATSL